MERQLHVRLAVLAAGTLTAACLVAGQVSPGTASEGHSPAASPTAAMVQPRVAGATTSAQAVIRTISVGSGPDGLAVDDSDDTVYVANYLADTVSIINGRTGTVASTIRVGSFPIDVAVNQRDDTVYVTNYGSGNVSVINGRTGVRTDDTIAVGSYPWGLAVDQGDDTVYVANYGSSSVSIIKGSSASVAASVAVATSPASVAVDSPDDTVYVANSSGALRAINGRTSTVASTMSLAYSPLYVSVNQADDTIYLANYFAENVSVIKGSSLIVDETITLGSSPRVAAIDQFDDTIYVGGNSGKLSVIDGRTGVRTDDTITVGGLIEGLAVDDSGVVYVSAYSSASVAVLAQVTPSRSPSSGNSAGGTSVTISLDVPQVPYDVDDATVQSVTFGGTPGTGLAAGSGDTWTVTAPAGSGTVPVVVTLNGGRTAAAGSFTYVGAPVITGITPSSGPAAGGTSVTLSGAALTGATSVTFDGTAASSFTVIDDTTITATTPANTPGPADVAVTTGGGTTTSTGAFTFIGAPVITGVTPSSGPAAGGTSVTISGALLTGATSVTIGGIPATSVTVVDDTTITATTPANTPGPADVAVTTGGGTTTSAGAFIYTSPPQPLTPSSPPGPPTGVVAVAGDAEAAVSWMAPADPGSQPVSNYLVTSAPGSRLCMTSAPVTSCTVGGLTNGIPYTFTVVALNGAGWGGQSDPSNESIPSKAAVASIVVTGSRDAQDPRLVRVTGASVGLVGHKVTPFRRLAGQPAFVEGIAASEIGLDGSFTWERRGNKRMFLYFTASACETCTVVRSNMISIPAR